MYRSLQGYTGLNVQPNWKGKRAKATSVLFITDSLLRRPNFQ
jgi:hypothetical protein